MEIYHILMLATVISTFILCMKIILRNCSSCRARFYSLKNKSKHRMLRVSRSGTRLGDFAQYFTSTTLDIAINPICWGLLIGIFTSLLLNFVQPSSSNLNGVSLGPISTNTTYNEVNLKDGPGWWTLSEDGEGMKIWFIMSTCYSLKEQEPALVRIAQALYPVRDFVTWVIISKESEVEQLEYLDGIIQRLSVPYVLLSLPARDQGISGHFNNSEAARQVGILWFLQNVWSGVVLMGDEEFTYSYQLFHEIRHTKTISVWPVELGKTNMKQLFSYTTDSVTGEKHCTLSKGRGRQLDITIGGVAINIGYFKKNLQIRNIWKLGTDSKYGISSLGIKYSDIELLKTCDKTFVWRTSDFKNQRLSKKWKLISSERNTNAEFLLRYIYRKKFDENFYFEYENQTKVVKKELKLKPLSQ